MALADQTQPSPDGGVNVSGERVVQALLIVAILLTVFRPWLPDGLVRPPEWMLLPWRDWIDAIFQYVTFDLGFINVTRFISGGLEFVLDAVGQHPLWPRALAAL